jgi:gluconate 5-dehydrogenase
MIGEIVHALGALGKPDDLIGVAVFLASLASAFVNRQILYVDGGLLAVV